MGCNSSKDGTSPSAQDGDNAPKDKKDQPADEGAQQSSANHDVAPLSSDDQVANGNTPAEEQGISDETEYNASQSQNKYEIPSENGGGDTDEIKIAPHMGTGEPQITDVSKIRDQNGNEENDKGQLQLNENGWEEPKTSEEPQQTESGGETTNDLQTQE